MLDALITEYRQWKFFTQEVYPKFTDLELCLKDKQECINVFQHWLLEVNQCKNIERYPNFPLLPKIDSSSILAQKLANALREKNIFWRNHHEDKFVNDFLCLLPVKNTEYSNYSISYPEIEGDKITIGDFKGTSFLNQPILIKKFKETNDRSFLVNIAKMLLRYESIGNGSYQWGDPVDFHEELYKKLNVLYEGFASPINSRFLYINKKYSNNFLGKKKKKQCTRKIEGFCSLFPEFDQCFGSLGNFFDLSILNNPQKPKNSLKRPFVGFTVNPPFLNSVMLQASQKIIDTLNLGCPYRFFCTYPYWIDSKAWLVLSESTYCQAQYHRSKCIIQDTTGRIFSPRIRLSLFCMSREPFSSDELKVLRELVDNERHGFEQELISYSEK